MVSECDFDMRTVMDTDLLDQRNGDTPFEFLDIFVFDELLNPRDVIDIHGEFIFPL